MNEMEKIAELYMDTAAELEKAAAEEGVDLDEVIEDMDDEEVAELLDAAVEDRLANDGYEVEASAFLFKTAELLEKAAEGETGGAGKTTEATKGWWTKLKGSKFGTHIGKHSRKYIGGAAGVAGLGAGALIHKLIADRRRRRG